MAQGAVPQSYRVPVLTDPRGATHPHSVALNTVTHNSQSGVVRRAIYSLPGASACETYVARSAAASMLATCTLLMRDRSCSAVLNNLFSSISSSSKCESMTWRSGQHNGSWVVNWVVTDQDFVDGQQVNLGGKHLEEGGGLDQSGGGER
jgi:hypothetical protein